MRVLFNNIFIDDKLILSALEGDTDSYKSYQKKARIQFWCCAIIIGVLYYFSDSSMRDVLLYALPLPAYLSSCIFFPVVKHNSILYMYFPIVFMYIVANFISQEYKANLTITFLLYIIFAKHVNESSKDEVINSIKQELKNKESKKMEQQ